MLKHFRRKAATQLILLLIRLNLLSWRADDKTHRRPGIYVFWHRNYLSVGKRFAHTQGIALCSPSHDGAANAALLQSLGYRIVWGSSYKNSAKALQHMLHALKSTESSVFLACDGSRGPAQTMKLGALYLAQKTKLPLFLVSARASYAIALNNWDKTLIPLPFARITAHISEPKSIPSDCDKNALKKLAEAFSTELNLLDKS